MLISASFAVAMLIGAPLSAKPLETGGVFEFVGFTTIETRDGADDFAKHDMVHSGLAVSGRLDRHNPRAVVSAHGRIQSVL